MGETEFKFFIAITSLIIIIFIGGIITVVFQYYKRKVIHEKEKAILHEQHLQDLLNERLDIQQQTMQDIGREIHDNVGQKLTLASIYAHQVTYENRAPDLNERVTEIGRIIDESLAELRSLSKNLTHATADVGELKEMLQNECKRVNALNICKMQCNFKGNNFSISNTIKNFILRIVQEFLQNSLKHANCKNIKLDFNYEQEGLTIKIEDDGKGFVIKAGREGEDGIGLVNMKKRAELIGADFELSSTVNVGTFLSLFIPCEKLKIS